MWRSMVSITTALGNLIPSRKSGTNGSVNLGFFPNDYLPISSQTVTVQPSREPAYGTADGIFTVIQFTSPSSSYLTKI